MLSYVFIFEPKPEVAKKIKPLLEHRFGVREFQNLVTLEEGLLHEDAKQALLIINWDRFSKPLEYLQKIRVWQRLIPIVVVSAKQVHDTCIAILREQVFCYLPKALLPTKLEKILTDIEDDYDMMTLRNMYYLSIRKRKFVFNKTVRYQEFQMAAQSLHHRPTNTQDSPFFETIFALPKPHLWILCRDVSRVSRINAEDDRYTLTHVSTYAMIPFLPETDSPDLLLVDIADISSEQLSMLGRKFPKSALVAWTASQDMSLTVACFQIGIFEWISTKESDVVLNQKIEEALHMKWEMESGGDIALYTRQFLFAAHCRYAFQQKKPVFWSDWFLFFKRGFPESTKKKAANRPIPLEKFLSLGISGLSTFDPTPEEYDSIFETQV